MINPKTGEPITGDEPDGTFEYGTEEYWYWKDTLGPQAIAEFHAAMKKLETNGVYGEVGLDAADCESVVHGFESR